MVEEADVGIDHPDVADVGVVPEAEAHIQVVNNQMEEAAQVDPVPEVWEVSKAVLIHGLIPMSKTPTTTIVLEAIGESNF